MVPLWYLLVRMEEKLENLTQNIERLRIAVKVEERKRVL
ncbi:MAG: YvrJ family protein [Candidatus Pararuminococcus gallinarum]